MVLYSKSSTKGLAPILPVHRGQQALNFDYLMSNNLLSIVDANMFILSLSKSYKTVDATYKTFDARHTSCLQRKRFIYHYLWYIFV